MSTGEILLLPSIDRGHFEWLSRCVEREKESIHSDSTHKGTSDRASVRRKRIIHHDDLNNRSQLLLEAFEILNIYSASTFGSSPFQALTTKSEQDRQLW